MSRGLNEGFWRGNLPADPDLRYVNETAVVNSTLYVNEAYKDSDGEWQERVQRLPFVVWGRNAEVLDEYTSKGSQIFIAGKLQERQYEDDRYTDEDGNPVTRYRTEIKVRRLDLLGDGPSGGGGDDSSDDDDDDLPF